MNKIVTKRIKIKANPINYSSSHVPFAVASSILTLINGIYKCVRKCSIKRGSSLVAKSKGVSVIKENDQYLLLYVPFYYTF